MKTMKTMIIALALGALLSATPAVAGDSPFGMLGIASASCDCSYKVDSAGRSQKWVFRAEPQIEAVERRGPADGLLEPGDYIVAIDGKLIVTSEGGRRFSSIAAGEPVVVTVRRDGRVIDERIVPRSTSGSAFDMSAFGKLHDDELLELSEQAELLSRLAVKMQRSAQEQSLQALRQLDQLEGLESLDSIGIELEGLGESLQSLRSLRLEGLEESMAELEKDLAELQSATPAGSFGMGLSFSGRITRPDDEDGAWEWDFDDPPAVTTVEFGSPAARAGIQTGDELIEIDGVKLDSRRGGELFSQIEPGQTVKFTYERDGERKTVSMKAVDRPRKLSRAHPLLLGRERADYSMTIGDTRIDVHSKGAVQTITRGDDENVVIIITSDGAFELRKIED